MPYVNKEKFDELVKARIIQARVQGELNRHDEFVKTYEGTFASRNRDSNFADLKSKRDLLRKIMTKMDYYITV